MYCSNCGTQTKQELNYCNSCGMRLTENKDSENSIAKSLSSALGYVGVFGLVGFIFLILILLEQRVEDGLVGVIAVFYLATVFGISAMILKQISNTKSTEAKPNNTPDFVPPQQIKSVNTNQLEEPKQAAASVVDATTRTLNKVPVERK